MIQEAQPVEGPRRPTRGILSAIRASLEVAASVMVVGVCGAMLWSILRASPPGAARSSARTARAAKPSDAMLPADPIVLDGAQLQGSRTARVAVVEYSDFQCPYCGKFARETLPEVERAFVKPGKVLFAFRQFPLESIHPFALNAAETTECAGRQGRFWQMHDLTFADQGHLDEITLHERARAAGLNADLLDQCLQSSAADVVRADAKTGTALAVSATPTFFLGTLEADGRVRVIKRLSGALPTAQFSAALNALLAAAATTGAATPK